MHKFQNPAFLLCILYATVVLLKWRHGLHHHISEKGGDTENRRREGGKRESNEGGRGREVSYTRKIQ